MKFSTLSPFIILSAIVLIYCCSSKPAPGFHVQQQETTQQIAEVAVPDSLPVTDYIEWLTTTFMSDSTIQLHSDFVQWSKEFGLDGTNEINARKFATISILHSLFTSNGAYNGAKGDVLNIPYLWHWVSPNPRHEIKSLVHNKLLKDIKPPKSYGKYATYADIDRTPYLFISEMFSKEPLYSHPECGTFNTFGWCSEREMAFTCLLEMLGIPSKVIASGNHSWSEAVVKLKSTTGDVNLHVHLDNTFNQLVWENNTTKIASWKAYTGDGKTTTWYNTKAHSEDEMKQIKSFKVNEEVGKKIYFAFMDYLK